MMKLQHSRHSRVGGNPFSSLFPDKSMFMGPRLREGDALL
jgi:hypothetical protein